MRGKEYLKDTMKSLVIGFIAGGIIIAVSAMIALLVNRGEIRTSLWAVRSTLCIAGALGLLLFSAMLLTKKTAVHREGEQEWRRHFKQFNLGGVVFTVSSVLLLLAGGIDSML